MKLVQYSIKRVGFTPIPEVTWEDAGSLDHVHAVLQSSICQPMIFPEGYKVMYLIVLSKYNIGS